MAKGATDSSEKILLRCPHCGALFMAKPEILGKKGPCRKCKKPFVATSDAVLKSPEAAGQQAVLSGDSAAGAELSGDVTSQTVQFDKGELVHANPDGKGYWEPARITERIEDRYLVTTFAGKQFYSATDQLRQIKLVPGCLVVSLDDERGSYVPGVVHAIEKDAVCVSDPHGQLHWRGREVVFPDLVDVGFRVVRKDATGRLMEAGRVSEKSPVGYRIHYDDGLELPWTGNTRGQTVGIIPGAVSPGAPVKPRSIWSNRQCLRTALVLTIVPVVAFCVLMLVDESWKLRLPEAVVLFALFVPLARRITKSVSPLFRRRPYKIVSAAVVGSILLLALLFHSGFHKIPAVVAYGALAILSCYLGRRKMPEKIQPQSKEKDDDIDARLGRSGDYRKGERVFCLPPREQFLHIGRVVGRKEKHVEVEIPGGETHVLMLRDLFPYHITARQRVLALRSKLKAYFPAIITHIEDDTFTVRFDDAETESCKLKNIWFPYRKEVVKLSRSQCEAMLETVGEARTQARQACDEGNTAKAHEIFAEALDKYPFDPSLHFGRALVYEMEGRAAEAAVEADDAIENLSSDPAPYTMLGNAYLQVDRFIEAEQAFRAALNLAPDKPSHWQDVGRALLKQGEEARAGSFLSEAKSRIEVAT